MRRLLPRNNKLRGIPRRLRELEHWAASFSGEFHPRIDEHERYTHWKIPVPSPLVQGPQARIDDYLPVAVNVRKGLWIQPVDATQLNSV